MTVALSHAERSHPSDSGPPQDIAREARRVLRRLSAPNVRLVVAQDMDQAVVLNMGGEAPQRLAVLDRTSAEAFALNDWIRCTKPGRVAQYEITSAGRALARELLQLEEEAGAASGCAEAEEANAGSGRPALVEAPLTMLARRKDRDGSPFLPPELVNAGERLREDFELANLGTSSAARWDRFLTGEDGSGFRPGSDAGAGAGRAAERVEAALAALGPGLADVVLRCCCHLEGLETAERRLGWSARSGKIVLRIALQRLARHYAEGRGGPDDLIG